jgi:lipopolysaccharide/colanic/teichoic acid biosynthesis glycosyltransferase
VPEPLTMIGLSAGVVTLGIHLARRFFDVAKEVFDVVAGAIALVLLSPLILICAIVVKCSSKGPVFFRSKRVGRGGKGFLILKLRTMYDARPAPGTFAWGTEDNDPRIVPACRWIRRCHLDELPQLINVIKGEMSLIGPRPERSEVVAELEKVCPEFNKRHIVRPGITGLAQIRNGYTSSVDGAIQKLRVDLEYIERQKWSAELQILAGTVPMIFGDNKAH